MWKRFLWIKNILFIVLFSYITAKIGQNLLLASIPTVPLDTGSQPEAHAKPRARISKRPLNYYRLIARRNIFNSEYTGDEDTAKQAQSVKTNRPLKKAELNVKLIGTVVGSRENSFAIIEDPRSRRQELYQVDDMIQDEARILKISRCKVVLLRNGSQEILECPEEGERGKTGGTSVSYKYSGTSSGTSAGVKKVSENEYVIDEG